MRRRPSADNFPVLTLEQVYGALTFYLVHQEEIDQSLRQGEAAYEKAPAEAP
jgi:uncharacterized protein (DUF433 family)